MFGMLAGRFALPIFSATYYHSSSFRDKWLVDTGADEHATNDLTRYVRFSYSDNLPLIAIADGNVKPLGSGNAIIKALLSTGKTKEILLYNVLYMPNLPYNLFLGKKLWKLGGIIDKH